MVTINKYHGNDWKMCEISFFGSRMSELLIMLDKLLREEKGKMWISTINPEFVMAMRADKKFADIIAKSDLRVVDGIGLIWAKEVIKIKMGIRRWRQAFWSGMEILRGKRRGELISGADLMLEMAREAVRKDRKIFLLGGFGERARKTAEFLRLKYPGLNCRWCQGEPELDNREVIRQINDFEPDYLLVAYGMRRQEEWIEKNLSKIKARVVMGVGRSFDYYSGELERAPLWLRKMGLEWLYSLFMEPKRFKRQLVLPKFIWMVLTEVT